ncbi:hypothetical protein [Nocardioides sp.]|uniref:hypothetical protein n=1 Tax=Nocardioides sp. TaxID=35761 RepID=UPI0035B09BD8
MNTQQDTQNTNVGKEKNPHKTDLDRTFPVLKHRPAPLAVPPAAKVLAPVRTALLKNPEVNLPEGAAGVVTAGLVDPARFRMLTEAHGTAAGESTSLLNRKRVGGGVLFSTPQHDRLIDMGVLPDVAGARWTHLLHNQLDVVSGELPTAHLGTAEGPDGHYAMLELDVADHAELAARVEEAFTKTVPDQAAAANDYTDSILQSGVKEPLLLVVMKVVFGDSSPDEFYLVSVDGNSRLVSLWKGRTGGSTADAAAACIKAVIGVPAGKSWKSVSQRQTRDRLTEQVKLVNKGLSEKQLTENTIRAGHTLTAPTVVVVGGRNTAGDAALTDMVAARDDLIATIHTDATPWSEAAQAEQGMSRLLRRALAGNLLTEEQYRVVEGQCTPAEMNSLVGLPPHRLWAAALTLQVLLNPWYETNGTGVLFREEFNAKNPTRLMIGRSVASTALSGYRSSPTLGLALNAFSDGGPIAGLIWEYRFNLTGGTDPVKVLDGLLQTALGPAGAKRRNARAQLCVLGGTAAMIDGLITRDRGSKLTDDGKRAPRRVPYRIRPYRLIDSLAATDGGLRALHSLAVAHVTGKAAKQFHTTDDPNGKFHDGDAKLDAAGAHATIELEWDVLTVADPARAEDAISAAGHSSGSGKSKDEAVRLREQMVGAAKEALKTIEKLDALAKTRGADVFGSYDAVEDIKAQLQSARDLLNASGPKQSVIFDDLDEDDIDDDLDDDDLDEDDL